ncbi:MAG: hypothetical protein MZU97_19420 [Bacillus subtilis]|nr:hypothetical protein [Bacillus subtilis]
MNTVKIDKYFRGMIAHRGLSGIETENTLAGVRRRGEPQLFRDRMRRPRVQRRQDHRHPRRHFASSGHAQSLHPLLPLRRNPAVLADRPKTGNLSEHMSIPSSKTSSC